MTEALIALDILVLIDTMSIKNKKKVIKILIMLKVKQETINSIRKMQKIKNFIDKELAFGQDLQGKKNIIKKLWKKNKKN